MEACYWTSTSVTLVTFVLVVIVKPSTVVVVVILSPLTVVECVIDLSLVDNIELVKVNRESELSESIGLPVGATNQ